MYNTHIYIYIEREREIVSSTGPPFARSSSSDVSVPPSCWEARIRRCPMKLAKSRLD